MCDPVCSVMFTIVGMACGFGISGLAFVYWKYWHHTPKRVRRRAPSRQISVVVDDEGQVVPMDPLA